MLDLSVIIVNWNTRDLLWRCLSSVYRYMHDVSCEVFVVDNGSSDGSPSMVEHEFPEVHLIVNQENLGFSKANNQALRQISGRYALLLNSDTALKDQAFQRMIAFMDAHPQVGIAGTRLLNSDGSRQYSCDCFPRRPMRLLWEKMLDRYFPGNLKTRRGKIAHWEYGTNFAVDYVIGAVLVIRRATLDDIGLLDEQFFMYAEDIDWCYRAALAGWETYYLGEISIFHHNRGSSDKSPQLVSHWQKMRAQSLISFYRKHYGRIAAYLIERILKAKTPNTYSTEE